MSKIITPPLLILPCSKTLYSLSSTCLAILYNCLLFILHLPCYSLKLFTVYPPHALPYSKPVFWCVVNAFIIQNHIYMNCFGLVSSQMNIMKTSKDDTIVPLVIKRLSTTDNVQLLSMVLYKKILV